jgi:rhodanese-related sulfurtransferase
MSARNVDAETLKQWLEEGSAALVDVREPAEYRANRIPGASLMPLGQVDAACFPGGRIVIHCQKGGRGAAACEKLLKQNPALDVYNIVGGIEGWSAAGLEVEHGDSKALPLDRQVQLAVGVMLLVTLALAVMAHPGFVWLVAVPGVGLTIAGLTGFCGLARILARMPWNR